MKKKLMCLFLSMLMLGATFTGCSQQNGEEDVESTADTEASSRVSMTLSLWLPTDENTTEEAVDQVEAALNRLTQAKYDTAIELHAIPRSQYQAAIDQKMADVQAAIEAKEAAEEAAKQAAKEAAAAEGIKYVEEEEEEETVAEEETYVNELGITVIKYPDVTDTQMDIFLVQGYENYVNYVNEDLIQNLDSELTATSKVLKTYVYPTYLELAANTPDVSGTYAIPNNHPVGEYSYLLVNKALVEEFDYDESSLSTLLRCGDFIRDMGYLKDHGEASLQDVTPLLGYTEPSNMTFWTANGLSGSEFSLLASQVTNTMKYSTKCAPKSVFNVSVYTNTLTIMKECTENGWIGDGNPETTGKFAVGVISGDASIPEIYGDDYYVTIYGKPLFSRDDIFGNMFAVSTYSKSLSRSMEIVTYLNTNTDFRTILQYGVEGTHWEYADEEKTTINVISKDYSMNLLETGNVYLTYPEAGKTLADWDYGKLQNLDSITSPYLFFGTTAYINENNKTQLAELASLSKEYKEKIDAMTAAEFSEAITEFKAEVKANELLQSLLDADNTTISPTGIYSGFHGDNYAE